MGLVIVVALAAFTFPRGAGDKRQLRVRAMFGEMQKEFFDGLEAEFEATHPDVDVVIEWTPGGSWTDYKIAILNDYANGTPPDVARINEGWLGEFIEAGLLEPAPPDVIEYLDSQPISDGLKGLLTVDGKTYGMIHAATWQCLYYNKDHFIEAGLDPDNPPETWDELLDHAEKLTKYDSNGNITQVGFSLRKEGYQPGIAMKFFDFYFSTGAEIFNEDRTECLMNSERGIRALEFYTECLYERRVDAIEFEGDNNGFANGTVSMFYRGPWVINSLDTNYPEINYGVANICADEISASNGGFYPLCVAAGSREKELAWEFVRLMMTPEKMAEHARNENMVPFDPVSSQWEEFAEKEAFAVFLRQDNVKEFPAVPNKEKIQTIIGETVERVARSGYENNGPYEDSKTALDEMVAEINILLNEDSGGDEDGTGELLELASEFVSKTTGVSPKLVSSAILAAIILIFAIYTISWWRKDPQGRWGFLLLTPMLIYFVIFFIYPIITSLTLSFWNYNPLMGTSEFIGFGNYRKCAGDDDFLMSLKNTFFYAFWVVVLGTSISLFLAVMLNRALRAVGLYRTMFFIPVITSVMAAVLVWKYIYYPDHIGLLNIITGWFGQDKHGWLTNSKTALGSLVAMAVWKNMGFNMLIFLAGLKAIPDSYYEAAKIDGADDIQQFRHITLPSLKPTILFVVITSLIAAFQVFTQVVGMTEGGPANSTRTIVYHIYETGFAFNEMGYASAAAVIMLILVGFITWIQMRVARD